MTSYFRPYVACGPYRTRNADCHHVFHDMRHDSHHMSAFICYLYLLFPPKFSAGRQAISATIFKMCIFEMCICVYVMSRISLKRDVQFVLHVEHVSCMLSFVYCYRVKFHNNDGHKTAFALIISRTNWYHIMRVICGLFTRLQLNYQIINNRRIG